MCLHTERTCSLSRKWQVSSFRCELRKFIEFTLDFNRFFGITPLKMLRSNIMGVSMRLFTPLDFFLELYREFVFLSNAQFKILEDIRYSVRLSRYGD